MKVSLRDWLAHGWLTEHKTSPGEIADLLAVVDRDLGQAQTPALGPDWKLAIAYNAALQAGVAALAAAGYRPSRQQKHFMVIQSLSHTVGLEREAVLLLDQFRKKRNISDYERAGLVSDQEAEEMLQLAMRLREEVTSWLRRDHPALLKG